MRRPSSAGRSASPKRPIPVKPKPAKQLFKKQKPDKKKTASKVVSLREYRVPKGAARIWLISLASAVVALLLFVLVATYSPLLAVQEIKISGTTLVKQSDVMKALKSELGKPLPQVSSAEVANLLKPFTLIESVSVVSSPPHTIFVRIVERTPIAIVYQTDGYYLFDPAGVKVGKATRFDNLPILSISGIPSSSATYAAAVNVILALPASLLPKISTLSAKSVDNVSMRLRGYAGQKVIWGDGSNSALKSRVLAALIKNQKPSDRVTYDVSSPTTPTVRY